MMRLGGSKLAAKERRITMKDSMMNEGSTRTARRVVAGLNSEGKSTVLLDEQTATRVVLPAFTVNDVWRLDAIPATFSSDGTLGSELQLEPPAAGLVVRLVTFPPDSQVDSAEYAASISDLHGADALSDSDEIVGLHRTDTVDIVTVLDGDLYAVYEDGEVLLHPGDTVINRGIKHAWSVRGDKPVTVVAVMLAANN
jgi:hypothetical protein